MTHGSRETDAGRGNRDPIRWAPRGSYKVYPTHSGRASLFSPNDYCLYSPDLLPLANCQVVSHRKRSGMGPARCGLTCKAVRVAGNDTDIRSEKLAVAEIRKILVEMLKG